MRRLAALIVVAALLAASWFVFGAGEDKSAPLVLDPDRKQQESGASVDSAADSPSTAESQQEDPVASTRLELERDAEDLDQSRGVLRVRVIHRDTKAAIGNAKVGYFDGQAIRYEEMSPEEREEYESLALDREMLIHRFGNMVKADPDGEARIQIELSDRYLLFVARYDGLYGESYFTPEFTEDGEAMELVIEIEEDRELELQVLDSLGKPAIDVPLSIRPTDSEGLPFLPGEVARSEAPDGRVRIKHLQNHLRNWQMMGEESTSFLLRPLIPGFVEVGVAFDCLEPPADPLILRLPPTGRALIRTLDMDGQPMPMTRGQVSLTLLPKDPPEDLTLLRPQQGESWTPTSTSGGENRFDWVIAGRPYVALVYMPGEWVREIMPGPAREGEVVNLTLQPTRRQYSLVGRILDLEGEPLANKQFHGSHQIFGARKNGLYFRTDSDGRFSMIVGRAEQEVSLEKLTIIPNNPDKGADEAFAMFHLERSIPLVRGENDLGDLSLVASPLLAAGRILVNGDAPGHDKFAIIVERLLDSENSRSSSEGWQHDRDLVIEITAQGVFEIRGRSQSTRHRIKLRPDSRSGEGGDLDYLPAKAIEFLPGASDLRLDLQTGGTLRAEVLVDDIQLMQSLLLELSPGDGQFHQEREEEESRRRPPPYGYRLYGQYAGAKADNNVLIFKWGTIWPGEYKLDIYPRGAREPMMTIPNLVITAGEQTDDPRLDSIDLRGKLHRIKISINEANGKPLSPGNYASACVFVDDPSPDAELHGTTVRNSAAVIYTSEAFVNLLVAARGYQPKKLRAVSEDQTVVLEPFPEVLLRLADGLPELPDAVVMRAHIRRESTQADRRRVMSDYVLGGSLESFLQPPNSLSTFDSKGELKVPVAGDGKLSVTLILDSDRRGGISISGIQPAQIEVDMASGREQVFEIQIPKESLEKALARMQR